ncbi:uncharacterized protein CDAR_239331 [Caerostris darwini]|uniref:Uncharacterized protein n=1 Tax=Caerostris darwini TaxID=1538125 RepID=A0AAV4SR33_9ARAC|nr:uncharacterized protein CDAR_239331 [Caerostris darwini]
MSFTENDEGTACQDRYRTLGTELRIEDMSTERNDEPQYLAHSAPVFRTDGEPVLDKRNFQGMRTRKSSGSSNSPHGMMGSNDGNILKSIILHLIKYPRRLNRAEAKSENYNLRANYIPRLGRKRSYPGKK